MFILKMYVRERAASLKTPTFRAGFQRLASQRRCSRTGQFMNRRETGVSLPQDDRPPRTRPMTRMVLKLEEYLVCTRCATILSVGTCRWIDVWNRNSGRPASCICRTLRQCLAIEVHLHQSKVRKSSRSSYCCGCRKIMKAEHECERVAVTSSGPGSAYVDYFKKMFELSDSIASCTFLILAHGEKANLTEIALVVMAPSLRPR